MNYHEGYGYEVTKETMHKYLILWKCYVLFSVFIVYVSNHKKFQQIKPEFRSMKAPANKNQEKFYH